MRKILLLSLILSFNILAQDKYVMLKVLSWDELQLYQLDSLKTADELNLAKSCPSTLAKLQETQEKKATHFQHILGTNYTWTVFSNSEELNCLVKQDKINSITQKDDEIINPNGYELLNKMQAQILISASLGIMDKNKKKLRNKQIAEAMRVNREIQEKPYIKYGGIENLVKFMKENTPSYSIDKRLLENKKYTTPDGSVGYKTHSPLEYFEIRYSQEQKNELIESVKKHKVKLRQTYSQINATRSAMQRVPDFKIFDSYDM